MTQKEFARRLTAAVKRAIPGAEHELRRTNFDLHLAVVWKKPAYHAIIIGAASLKWDRRALALVDDVVKVLREKTYAT